MNTQCVQQAKGVNLIKKEKESVPMSTNKPDRTVECATQLKSNQFYLSDIQQRRDLSGQTDVQHLSDTTKQEQQLHFNLLCKDI